jgi:uncharacterized protein
MKPAPRRGNGPLAFPFILIAAALLVSLSSCASKKEVADSPNPKLPTATIRVGSVAVLAEVARSETERERGLMFRKGLEEGKGMIFVFDRDDQLAFWMKNTLIPLSLAYISSDGAIRQIVDLEPRSLAPVKSERSVRYALEMPRGWFERAGVRVGDTIDLGALN